MMINNTKIYKSINHMYNHKKKYKKIILQIISIMKLALNVPFFM